MRELPKIELHCHLDGSVRPSTLIELAMEQGIKLPSVDEESIEKLMKVSDNCQSLEEYLEKFHLPNEVLQTASALERVTYELFEDAAKENVKYLEVRFGPHLHTGGEMNLSQVIESVISGMNKATSEHDIKGNIILSSLRNHSMDSLYELIEAGKDYLNHGVVGLDLCSVEQEGFVKPYEDAFKLARQYGYRVTIHAGEAASGTNVLEAVKLLGAERIGHGVQLVSNLEAYDLVKGTHVHLEMCPTSNVQTTAVASLTTHPIMDYMRDGIKVSIATDNRTVSNTDMTKEINLVSNSIEMTIDEYHQMYLNAIEASFASNDIKAYLKEYANNIQ